MPTPGTGGRSTVHASDRTGSGGRLAVAVAVLAAFAAFTLLLSPAGQAGAQASLPDGVENAVREDAADRAGVDEDDVEIARAEAVTWNDGCLGIPSQQPCTQALVDGYVVWAEAGGSVYRYHTDGTGNTVLLAESGIDPDDVAGAPIPGGGTPRNGTGNGTLFTGDVPATGGVGLLTATQAASASQLVDALSAQGCTAQTISITEGGAWLVYVSGAPAFVNAGFPDMLDAGQPFLVRCATGGTPPLDDGAPELTAQCTNPDAGYTVSYPGAWSVNTGEVVPECSLFHPEPFEVEPATEVFVAVSFGVEPVAYADAVDGATGEFAELISQEDTTVADRTATRFETRSTGGGLLPDGVRRTEYYVELSDEQTLVAAATEIEGIDYDEAVEVLDAMVATLTFEETEFALTAAEKTDASGAGVIVDARVAEHEGYDRFVLEFAPDWEVIEVADGVPNYSIEYVNSASECGSGFAVETDGDAMLQVNLPQAYVYDPNTGESTVDALEILQDFQVILEVQEICGFEGQSIWIVGTESEQPFRLFELSNPTRLVIDVAVPAS